MTYCLSHRNWWAADGSLAVAGGRISVTYHNAVIARKAVIWTFSKIVIGLGILN
jgi:hypothetical protein